MSFIQYFSLTFTIWSSHCNFLVVSVLSTISTACLSLIITTFDSRSALLSKLCLLFTIIYLIPDYLWVPVISKIFCSVIGIEFSWMITLTDRQNWTRRSPLSFMEPRPGSSNGTLPTFVLSSTIIIFNSSFSSSIT